MKKLINHFARIVCALCGLFYVTGLYAQSADIIQPRTATTYLVEPDYRRCAFPMCGGWFLTPVNQYSVQLETEAEADANARIKPSAIYVAYIDYRRLGLTPEEIRKLQSEMYSKRALLSGYIVAKAVTPTDSKTLLADGAWIAANDNPAKGPFLNVTSSGIVCITTPCPYYNADLINTPFSHYFHDLNFDRARLTREQLAQAWQAVSGPGLVMTGVRYESQGQTGTGIGIAATKVYFSFPASRWTTQ